MMNVNLKDYVSIGEFAKLSKMALQSLYQYRHLGAYDFPEPDLKIGSVLLWKRARAEAWAKKPRG